MEFTCTPCGTTVTTHTAVTPPATAVIMAVPSLRATTKPSFIVATDGSEDSHLTSGKVASAGSTVADSISIPPTLSVTDVLLRVTDSTSTSGGRQELKTSPKLRIATIAARNFFICR